MRFYKVIKDGYILRVGTGMDGTEITEDEYNEILAVIRNKPSDTETVAYRLRDDLTWESYDKEPEPEPEPDADELLEILLGGGET